MVTGRGREHSAFGVTGAVHAAASDALGIAVSQRVPPAAALTTGIAMSAGAGRVPPAAALTTGIVVSAGAVRALCSQAPCDAEGFAVSGGLDDHQPQFKDRRLVDDFGAVAAHAGQGYGVFVGGGAGDI
jgi:hypothetical protein